MLKNRQMDKGDVDDRNEDMEGGRRRGKMKTAAPKKESTFLQYSSHTRLLRERETMRAEERGNQTQPFWRLLLDGSCVTVLQVSFQPFRCR